MDYIDIGGSPHNEVCAALGKTEDFETLNRLECTAYMEALRRKYGKEPEGVTLRMYGNRHDFGTYRDVRAVYDESNDAAREWAWKTEDGVKTWFEVGMWKPVSYDRCQPIYIISEPALWDMKHNPKCRRTAAEMALDPAEAPTETAPA